jgi:SnoaL-like domain
MRLPPRSRLRRLMVARRAWQAYAAANRQDFDLVLVGWDPGSEYHPSGDLMPPDLETVFHGRDGYLQLWRYWLDAFEDIRWDPEEILDVGDKLLVRTQERGHGSGSGVAVSRPVFQLFIFPTGLGCPAAGLPGSLEGPRSRWAARVARSLASDDSGSAGRQCSLRRMAERRGSRSRLRGRPRIVHSSRLCRCLAFRRRERRRCGCCLSTQSSARWTSTRGCGALSSGRLIKTSAVASTLSCR